MRVPVRVQVVVVEAFSADVEVVVAVVAALLGRELGQSSEKSSMKPVSCSLMTTAQVVCGE